MTHRAEQIMVAVLDNVTGLSTTAGRVFRDLEYDIKETPALSLEYGGEEFVSFISNSVSDWELFFSVDIYVKQEGYSTIVNKIRSEITIALLADHKQGLNFVKDTEELSLSPPESGFDSEQPTVRQSMTWKIMYRRNITTPE